MNKPAALLSLALFLAATSAGAAELKLTPHAAEYKVKISILSGRLNTELKLTESGYLATHTIKPTGIAAGLVKGEIFAESEFRAGDDGLVPLRYAANDEISKDKLRADIRFDWEAQRVTGSYQTKDDPEPVSVDDELEQFAHDAVSIQYELMYDLMNEGASREYTLFDVDELKKLNISSVGTQTVKTRAGSFDAIGIRHQADNSSRQTTLWCVPELGYLPVMIEQHRKGKLRFRAKLVRYEPLPHEELSAQSN
ncbi:MAG: DUF3108 domain-containing protein [Pseudomonadota bacterium]